MNVLVFGLCPSIKPTVGETRNATFKRLESWMDELGIKYFSFSNTFDYPAPPTLSKVDYKRLCTLCKDYDKIVALGGFVSSALNRIDVRHFPMPHPSPLNRRLNDRDYEIDMIDMCEAYIYDGQRSTGVLRRAKETLRRPARELRALS